MKSALGRMGLYWVPCDPGPVAQPLALHPFNQVLYLAPCEVHGAVAAPALEDRTDAPRRQQPGAGTPQRGAAGRVNHLSLKGIRT